MEQELIKHAQKDLIKWSCPREVEFVKELQKPWSEKSHTKSLKKKKSKIKSGRKIFRLRRRHEKAL